MANSSSNTPLQGGAYPRQWICLWVEAQQELKICQGLEKLKLAAYLPICRASSKSRYFAARSATVPLFPRYVFSEPLDGDQYLGLQRAARLGGQYLPRNIGEVPDEIIREIRAREDHQGYVILSSSHVPRPDEYAPGDELDISAGPFTGNTALFSRREGERIFALMTLFGQMRVVQFTEQQLRKAEL